MPDDADYTNETQVSWSANAWLKPACVFLPNNAKDLSYAVKLFKRENTLFAMRGGGHMPIPDAANIDSSGVLVSSTNLNTLKFSNDKSVLSVGPGPRWGDVFTYMNNSGLAIVGGRLGAVGVPGLLLGGGISYYSYERGLASTNGNIAGYECVLADGRVVEVNAKNYYSDLYWALQGGGNSFCLVTRFDLNTFTSPKTMLADASYGDTDAVKEAWLASVLEFAVNADKDPKAAITPVARFGVGYTTPKYESTLFYNGKLAKPEVLKDFLGGRLTPIVNGSVASPLTPAEDGLALNDFPLADYGALVRPAFEAGGASHGLRQKFHVVPTLATAEAMSIVHDTYFAEVKENLSNVTDFFTGLAYNPTTKTMLKAINAKPGALQGVDETPSFWVEQSCTWSHESDDARMEKFFRDVNAKILEKLQAANLTSKYHYLNDADKGQPVFESYAAKNLKKLKAIREKYDPEGLYTDQMPGGFKVAHAYSDQSASC
ncbi:hypothetical protein ACHAPQ_007832 [Fusarium lateritium]